MSAQGQAKRAALEAVAKRLMEKETIDGIELREILDEASQGSSNRY